MVGNKIDPFSDFGFKVVFGKEENKRLLISFLNSLLKGEYEIIDVDYLDKEQKPDSSELRSMIYDVYCKTNDGKYVICEMQNSSQDYFQKRSLCYASSAVLRQSRKGEDWRYDIKTVLCISVLNFESRELCNAGGYRKDVVLMDRDTHEVFSKDLHLIYLTMPRFTKELKECETDLELWMYNLKHMKTMDVLPNELKGGVFEDLWKVLDIYSLPEDEQIRYEREHKIEADRKNIQATQERRIKEADEKVKEADEKVKEADEKVKEADEKRVAAEEVMRAAKAKMLDMARCMKSAGIPVEVIKQSSQLSDEEINAL
jgi:predicted transposase/invertase (TIGR01784 family)